MDITIYLTFAISMFAVLNPIGNAALYIGMTSQYSPGKQKKTALVCTFSITVIMLLSIWIGQAMLQAFGISVGAFAVAGGMIVFLIGLGMVRTEPLTHHYQPNKPAPANESHGHIAVVPLAIPIIAGPGAISAIIAHAYLFNTFNYRAIESLICIILAGVVGFILTVAPWVAKLLGEDGMKIVTRIMGLVLCAIAVQMTAGGIIELFKLHPL